MGALEKDSLPDAADTELDSTVHDTAPSSLPGRAEPTANNAYGFLPSDLPNRDAVADVLRGLKDGQDDPWAPIPEFVASSAGAEFAAYQGRHAPAVRHDTPTPAGAAVIVNITEPLPVPAPAAPADATQLDLATLIERAKARAEAVGDEQAARNEREGETTFKRGRRAISPGALRALQITLLALGVLVVLGLVYAFAISGPSANSPAGASATASSLPVTPAVAPPSASALSRPISAPATEPLPSPGPSPTAVMPTASATSVSRPSFSPRPTPSGRSPGTVLGPSSAPTSSSPSPRGDIRWNFE